MYIDNSTSSRNRRSRRLQWPGHVHTRRTICVSTLCLSAYPHILLLSQFAFSFDHAHDASSEYGPLNSFVPVVVSFTVSVIL
ncbi:hypothetical protein Y032_0298g1767 [Ancylostoma ceylanicum]|uniref:Uncharacterized protein n=1 Tax=Ancylostoma ceylanicum TaxID=53326 RepID=A0A016S456_9BILA|nr:hypothetical protein Y032_0298g1767 [Ancylostoma ceylanicum]